MLALYSKIGGSRCVCAAMRRQAGERIAVFQTPNYPRPVTLRDVDDCLDATNEMFSKDKGDYFASQGVNFINVVRYYNKVKMLERCFNTTENKLWYNYIINFVIYVVTILVIY